MAHIPTYDLNDGTTIPAIGFGTYPLRGDDGTEAIRTAIEAGYRLVDTAVNYENEAEVGEAIRRSGVPRDELVVACKIPGRHHAYDEAIASVRESLDRLGLERTDLHLIHWPNPSKGAYVEAWRALVQLQKDGLVRSIGVSNFTQAQLERIIDETGIVPVVDQIETHPYFQQKEMLPYLSGRGIHHESYSPLGSGEVLDDSIIAGIAAAYDKSPAQIILRWHLQRGSIVIPKSEHAERIEENFDVFGFTLDDADMGRIAGLDKGEPGRTGSNPETFNDLY